MNAITLFLEQTNSTREKRIQLQIHILLFELFQMWNLFWNESHMKYVLFLILSTFIQFQIVNKLESLEENVS